MTDDTMLGATKTLFPSSQTMAAGAEHNVVNTENVTTSKSLAPTVHENA